MFSPKTFRPEAISYYMSRHQDGVPVPLRIAPAWTWWIFWSLFGIIVSVLIFSIIIKVEVRGYGRGVFYVASGARPILTQTSGTISHIYVSRGQQVKPGDLMLELESAAIQAQLFEVERAIEFYKEVTKPTQAALEKIAETQLGESIQRHELQKEQYASIEQSVKLYEYRLETTEEMNRHGLVSAIALEEAKESMNQARRSVISAKQALMASEQEISSARARIASDRLRNQQELQNLTTKKDALAYSIYLTKITAIESGVIEGLHVRIGDIINQGQIIGRILTDSAEPAAFALLAETDRAHVKPGDLVRLEVDQYPKAEWGIINATIHRVPDSPATPSELREIFGESITASPSSVSSYIVELRFPASLSGPKEPLGLQNMQSGMGFSASYILKRQRPIIFILEPLRRWLE
ncbi:MAG: biotin/lipoyl-binding protein [Holophagaceae bacterium]|nr:biotin/lipoyl-binding protein [Holophagaceae bacterium]